MAPIVPSFPRPPLTRGDSGVSTCSGSGEAQGLEEDTLRRQRESGWRCDDAPTYYRPGQLRKARKAKPEDPLEHKDHAFTYQRARPFKKTHASPTLARNRRVTFGVRLTQPQPLLWKRVALAETTALPASWNGNHTLQTLVARWPPFLRRDSIFSTGSPLGIGQRQKSRTKDDTVTANHSVKAGRPEIGHAFPGRTGRQLNPKRESRCSASRALWTAFFKTPAPSHSRREWRFHLLQQQRRPAHGGLHAEAATGKRVALRRCSDILPAGPAQQSSQSENGGPTGAQGPCLHIPEVTSKRDAFPLWSRQRDDGRKLGGARI
ncbi:uncharacterized protein LOC144110916 [Amblyomma americanum]